MAKKSVSPAKPVKKTAVKTVAKTAPKRPKVAVAPPAKALKPTRTKHVRRGHFRIQMDASGKRQLVWIEAALIRKPTND